MIAAESNSTVENSLNVLYARGERLENKVAITPLTHLETRVLTAIEHYIALHGVSPTIAELALSLRLRSKGTVHRYVQSLIDKGRLERTSNGWRGLQVVSLGPTDSVISSLTESSDESKSNVIPLRSGINPAVTRGDFRIPLLGRIAAGLPIEAIEDQSHLDLAEFFIGPDRYALRVTGESMIDAGILDGDTVILRKQNTAHKGEIVVALIDGQEATLKRLGDIADGMIELIPENTAMQTMRYSVERVSIQGVLVGQLRSY